MPAPVGDCSTPPRGYIFREWQERALRGVSRERRVLAARLLVSHCFHSGVSYGHFAISMRQADGPHPYQGRVRLDLSGEVGQVPMEMRGPLGDS